MIAAKPPPAPSLSVELAATLIAERQNGPLALGTSSGKQGKLNWSSREEIVAEDSRKFLVLVRIGVRVADQNDREIYAATTQQLKRVPG